MEGIRLTSTSRWIVSAGGLVVVIVSGAMVVGAMAPMDRAARGSEQVVLEALRPSAPSDDGPVPAASATDDRGESPTPALSPAPVVVPAPTPDAPPTDAQEPAPSTDPAPGAVDPSAPPAPDVDPATLASVGVRPGVELTPTEPGELVVAGMLSGVVIDGDAVVSADDVTLRDVQVTGTLTLSGDGITVERSTVGALVLAGTAGAEVRGVEVRTATSGPAVLVESRTATGRASDVLLTDVVVRARETWGPVGTGILVRGVDGLTLERVAVRLGSASAPGSSALHLEDAHGGNHAVAVRASTLLGGEHVLTAHAHGLEITGSVLGQGRSALLDPRSWVEEMTPFTGNTDATGAALVAVRAEGGVARLDRVDG